MVGAARADVVEEDDAILVLERGRDQAPHVLVAAEPVGEQHRRAVDPTGQVHVVPREHAHEPDFTGRAAIQPWGRRPVEAA